MLMGETSLKDILVVIQRTINSVDSRLENHGEQVSYLCLQIGRAMGLPDAQILPLCSTAMIHDIGAYKVEERQRMTEFEVIDPHEHAVYGSLFFRYFSPLHKMADAILYHHWKYEDRFRLIDDRPVPWEGFLIHLADRVSVLYKQFGNKLPQAIEDHIPKMAETVFDPKHVDTFIHLLKNTDIIEKMLDGRYLPELYDYLDSVPLDWEQSVAYLCMLVYAIEFRSRSTVTHSISVEACARQIAELMHLSDSDRNILRSAALLHDVGKITIPIDVLTKPGKLTPQEMDTMRRHVVATSEIIGGTGLDHLNSIASSHHEKLNGKGYPKGLSADQLCTKSRILAVADIFTALVEPRYYKPALSKDEVLAIMARSAAEGEIDTGIVGIVEDKFDRIISEMDRKQREALALYDNVMWEYDHLMQMVHSTLGISPVSDITVGKAA